MKIDSVLICFVLLVVAWCSGDVTPTTRLSATKIVDYINSKDKDLSDVDNLVPTRVPSDPVDNTAEILRQLQSDRSVMLDFEMQMSKLRLELSEVIKRKEAQTDFAVEISELKVQTESVKTELRKVGIFTVFLVL